MYVNLTQLANLCRINKPTQSRCGRRSFEQITCCMINVRCEASSNAFLRTWGAAGHVYAMFSFADPGCNWNDDLERERRGSIRSVILNRNQPAETVVGLAGQQIEFGIWRWPVRNLYQLLFNESQAKYAHLLEKQRRAKFDWPWATKTKQQLQATSSLWVSHCPPQEK